MTTFRTYLRIFLSHRVYIAIYLVMLSLVGVFIGLSASPAATGEYRETSANVAVIDRDGSELSSALARRVLAGNNQVDVADERRAIQDSVARDRVSYLLVIPRGGGGPHGRGPARAPRRLSSRPTCRTAPAWGGSWTSR